MISWIRLKEVRGEAFRSYVDPFRVGFPEAGLCQIRGQNADTGDTSDSGKSTLMHAITHVLGGCPWTAKSCQSWYTESPMQAAVVIGTPGGDVDVIRGKGGLRLKRGAESWKGAGAEEVLDRIFGGMDARARAAATYVSQGSAGLFLTLSDEDKKLQLARLIPEMSRYEIVSIAAGDAAKLLEADVGAAEREVAAAAARRDTRVQALREAEVALEVARAENVVPGANREALEASALVARRAAQLAEQDVTELRGRRRDVKPAPDLQALADIDQAIHAVETAPAPAAVVEAGNDVQTCRDRRRRVEESDAERRLGWERASAERRIEIAGLTSAASPQRLRAAQDAGTVAEAALLKLRGGRCPTCDQVWVSSAAEAVLEAKIYAAAADASAISAAASDLRDAVAASAAVPAFEPHPYAQRLSEALRAAEVRLAGVQGDDRRRRAEEVSTLRRRAGEIERLARDAVSGEIARIDVEIAAAERDLAAAMAGLRQAETALVSLDAGARIVATQERAVAGAVAAVVTTADALADAEGQLVLARDRFNFERDVAMFSGRQGFLGAMVADILAEIADTANSVLAGINNVRDVVFRFDPDPELKRISPVVVVAGEQQPLGASLSGGQGTAVMRAVDLAYGEVVAKHRGAYPGWLLLDESFNGLGPVSREAAMEMLQRHAAGRLVVCIDHASEATGFFDHVVETRTVDRCSRVL